jgi:hypothetical protein
VDTTIMSKTCLRHDDELLDLLEPDSVPLGAFLVEAIGGLRVLWRISEGEPADMSQTCSQHDGALEPAAAAWLSGAMKLAAGVR